MKKPVKINENLTVYRFSELSRESQDFAINQYMDVTGLTYDNARAELHHMEEGTDDDDMFSKQGSLIVW